MKRDKTSYQVQKENASKGWRKYHEQLKENTRLKRQNAWLARGRERMVQIFGKPAVDRAFETHYKEDKQA